MTAIWDVFISYCSKDKVVVRAVADRLKADGLRVWFDEWEIRVGDSIPAKLEEGLEHSRVLVLCMSANAFGSEWARLESGTFRFRDPLNKDRRFIPLRLDDTPAPGSLAQFRYVDWREGKPEGEYQTLLAACRPAVPLQTPADLVAAEGPRVRTISLGHTDKVSSVGISPDGKRALSGSEDNTLRLWDLDSARCLKVFEGHIARVSSVGISPDGKRALSGSEDNTLRLWDLDSARCLKVFEGHVAGVLSVGISPNGKWALSGAADKTLRLWDLDSARCLKVFEGHIARVSSVGISPDGKWALSGAADNTLRLWDLDSARSLKVFEGHSASILSVGISPDGKRVLSGAADKTLRLWDLESAACVKVFRGHSASVLSVGISPDGKRALSGSEDNTLRLWDLKSAACVKVFEGHSARVWSVRISSDGKRALSGSDDRALRLWDLESAACLRVLEGHSARVWSVGISPDGKRALSGSADNTLRLWDLESAACLRVFEGHSARVWSVGISPDGKRALSGSEDNTLRLWDLESAACLKVFEGHFASVFSVGISPDGKRALSGSDDYSLRLWDLESAACLKVFEGHTQSVFSVAISQDGRWALSGSGDKTLRLWDLELAVCLKVFKGHSHRVFSVGISPDGKRALSGSEDKTLRLWDLESAACLKVFEGHSARVWSVGISPDGKWALSGSDDHSLRLWDLESALCLRALDGHSAGVRSVAIGTDGRRLFSASLNGVLRVWDLAPSGKTIMASPPVGEVPYTNAKVLLVGDSGVGKTGLAHYLADGTKDIGSNTSTDGAWATHVKLPQTKEASIDREIYLWDFAGQVDYRLVHQLFMDDTSAAVLVFNPQNENPFEGLAHWDRDLHKATRKKFTKLLTAGRVDRGGLVVSNESLHRFMTERGFHGDLHLTSAMTGQGCDELRTAIANAIDWDGLAVTSSPGLYRRMKEEILSLRDTGLVLLRLAELKQRMELALGGESFDLSQLETVVGLLAGPGMIMRVGFGDFILLRPEVLSRYASALVHKVRSHPQELGCIAESDLLEGRLDYRDFQRLPKGDEDVLLRQLHEVLINRAWCFRQICDGTTTLTFPSYFRRERKEQPTHPSVLVSYRFAGPVDEIYATLVVRLHHTTAFDTESLWKSAADFQTQNQKGLGILLTREAEGTSRLDVYFAPDVDENSRVLFLRYVHDHLTAHAHDVVRLRRYTCAKQGCAQPFTEQTKIDKAMSPGGKGKVFCPDCGEPITLYDLIEKKFNSPEVKEQSRKLGDEGDLKIDNESRELILVGHAYAIAGEAGQIYRGITNGDHGIDGEIEFKDDQGRASGQRLYLQLKSGDSYLSDRKRDNAEVFQIKNPRWVSYWQQQAYPVMLVIRASNGDIRWMDVSDYLRREARDGKTPKQIIFKGEPFNVTSVRRMRERVLASATLKS